MGFCSAYLPEYRDRLIIIAFPQWSGSLSNPWPVIINWFFQFMYYGRCYLHLLFSTFITDEANIVPCLLKFVPWVHFFIFTWAFIQVFFLFWRNSSFFRCTRLCVFFEVSLDVFNNLFWVVFSCRCYVSAAQFQTLRSHVSFLATFVDEHGCWSQHVSNFNSANVKHLLLLPSPTASSQPTLPCSIHHLSCIICHQWQLPISSLLNPLVSIFLIFNRPPSPLRPPLNSVKWSSPQNNSCHGRYNTIQNISSTIHIFRNEANSPSWW